MEEDKKVEIIRLPIEIEMRERDRWKTEITWLDTKFFIPVDFGIVDAHYEGDKAQMREDFMQIPAERRVQYEYMAHNSEIIEELKKYEGKHGVSVFKYITYEQMAHIYGFGIMTKAELEAFIPAPIASNEKCLTPMQFGTISDAFRRYRNSVFQKS
jgi:hypothetical protein